MKKQELKVARQIEILYHQTFKHQNNIFGACTGITFSSFLVNDFKKTPKGAPVNRFIQFNQRITQSIKSVVL